MLEDLVHDLLRCEENSSGGVNENDEDEPIERRQYRLCLELLERIKAIPIQSAVEGTGEDGRDDEFLRRRPLLNGDRMEIDQDDDDDDDDAISFGSSTGGRRQPPSSKGDSPPSLLNIRSILGPSVVTSATVSRLLSLLVDGMNCRVDTSDVLPLTYDEQANRQAMLGTAITLTPLSMACAELYARVLAIPGALGSGFVDVGAMQGVSAVVERWSAECRGKESDMMMMMAGPPAPESTAGAGRSRSERASQRPSRRNQPAKRKKKPVVRANEYMSSSDDDDDDRSEGSYELEILDGGGGGHGAVNPRVLTASQLMVRGLEVAAAVARLPTTALDFFSWSEEAREVTLTATITALAMASSLKQAKKIPASALGSAVAVVEQSTSSLITCVPRATSDTLDSETLTKRVHAARTILKGLNPLLLFHREVAVGQKGKQAAAEAAASTMELLIANVAADMDKNPQSWPKDPAEAALTSPMTNFGSPGPHGTATGGAQTPRTTNKTPRRTPFTKARRRSSGGGMTLTPVRLKSASKTPGTASLLSPSATLNATSGTAKPRPVLREVLALLQRLMLDPSLEAAASTRHHVVDTVNRCIQRLPQHEREMFVCCLGSLLHSKWWYCRQVSCEIASRVLKEPWFWRNVDPCVASTRPGRTPAHEPLPSSARSVSSSAPSGGFQVAESILDGLLGRLDDKDRNLRISCANGLTLLFQSARGDETSNHVKECLVRLLSKRSAVLSSVLRDSCLEEDKALAKKAFIGTLVDLLVTSQSISGMDSALTLDDVAIFSRFCQDVSVETRRAAAEALSTLLEASLARGTKGNDPIVQALESAWSEAVLPLGTESDSRLSSRILSLFDRILFDPIVGGDEGCARNQSAWRIVGIASVQGGGIDSLEAVLRRKLSESRGECLRPLVTALVSIASSTLLDSAVVPSLTSAARNRRDGAWCMFKAVLAALSNVSDLIRILKKDKRGLGLFVECWQTMATSVSSPLAEDDGGALIRSMGNCLEVIAALSSQLDGALAADAASSIEGSLAGFRVPEQAIGSAVTALAALTASLCNTGDGRDSVLKRCEMKVRSLLDVCERELAGSVQGSLAGFSESNLVRALFSAGELSLVGFSEDEDTTATASNSATRRPNVASDLLVGLHVRPPPRLVQLVQTLLSPTALKSDSNDVVVANPSMIRSLAFLSLGKMCLRDESLTIKSLNLFARELHEGGNGSPDVQANALVVLGDLSVRYANHVDRFLPVMATCLQAGVSKDINVLDPVVLDGYEVVRVQAVHLLSNLIMQDYIKWRGLLFHRFLVATADDVDQVAFVANRTLSGPLLTKKPQLFVQNFVESIFVMNRCTTHPIYKAASMSGDGGSGISVDFEGIHLDGSLGYHRRLSIYKMMLRKMSDEQKIEVTARLVKEVLGNALESGNDIYKLCHLANPDVIDLENDPTYSRAYHVLRDALIILRSKVARVSRRRGAEPAAGEDAESRKDRVASLKGEFLSKVNRAQLVDIIVPILVRLKATLQQNRSPLLQAVMGYLLTVFEAYPNQCRDILGNEPQVLAEIEYDFKAAKRSRQAHRESNSFAR